MLQLLEPALQNPNPAYRRSSFMCMGVIAEGCSEAIVNKYLEVMLNIIKAGIADSVLLVRAKSTLSTWTHTSALPNWEIIYAEDMWPYGPRSD